MKTEYGKKEWRAMLAGSRNLYVMQEEIDDTLHILAGLFNKTPWKLRESQDSPLTFEATIVTLLTFHI